MAYKTVYSALAKVDRNKVFGVLFDFGNMGPGRSEMIESVSVVGNGIGMERHIKLVGADIPVVERLEFVQPPEVISYSMINESPLPVARYHAVVRLREPYPGWCEINWGSNWIARGQSDAEVNKFLVELYANLSSNIFKSID